MPFRLRCLVLRFGLVHCLFAARSSSTSRGSSGTCLRASRPLEGRGVIVAAEDLPLAAGAEFPVCKGVAGAAGPASPAIAVGTGLSPDVSNNV